MCQKLITTVERNSLKILLHTVRAVVQEINNYGRFGLCLCEDASAYLPRAQPDRWWGRK